MFNGFRKKETVSVGTPEFMIVGLGNPDKKYSYTRHNSGFLCIDELASENNFSVDRLKFKSLVCDTKINNHRCIVMKPQTYMNNSGEAVRECAAFYKIPPERIIVIYDDIYLDIGQMRIRRKGSDGGHNGIKSIIYHLNSNEFPRIKIGAGKKPHPEFDLAMWVLKEYSKKELDNLKPIFENACKAIELLTDGESEKAMNLYNR